MLLNEMRFSCPGLPSTSFDVSGSSQRALPRSHFNDSEAELCTVLAKHLKAPSIAADNICVITLYKKQHRLLETSMRERH